MRRSAGIDFDNIPEDVLEAISNVLNNASLRMKYCFIHYWNHGKNLAAIARELGISQEAVRKLLRRCHNKIKREYERNMAVRDGKYTVALEYIDGMRLVMLGDEPSNENTNG